MQPKATKSPSHPAISAGGGAYACAPPQLCLSVNHNSVAARRTGVCTPPPDWLAGCASAFYFSWRLFALNQHYFISETLTLALADKLITITEKQERRSVAPLGRRAVRSVEGADNKCCCNTKVPKCCTNMAHKCIYTLCLMLNWFANITSKRWIWKNNMNCKTRRCIEEKIIKPFLKLIFVA